MLNILKGLMPKRLKSNASRKNTGILPNLLIIPNSDARIPAYARMYEELKGVCIGGCIATEYGKDEDGKAWSATVSNKEVFAHAHNYIDDVWFGFICSPHKRLLTNKWCLLHEVAHLIVHDEGHTKKWKETVVSIGGSIKQKSITWKYRLRDYGDVKEIET